MQTTGAFQRMISLAKPRTLNRRNFAVTPASLRGTAPSVPIEKPAPAADVETQKKQLDIAALKGHYREAANLKKKSASAEEKLEVKKSQLVE